MDLVLDIGNSTAKAALFAEGGALQRAFRLDLSPATAGPGDWERALRETSAARPHRVALASVVPAATKRAQAALSAIWQRDAFAVRAAAKLPFALAYRTPGTLGADRVAAATAAWTRYGTAASGSVLALDAGTALTYEVVRAAAGGGVYEGGAIAPGPALLQRALSGGTAQLPTVPLDLPPSPIGTTTQEAIQSGLLHGLLDSADGMVRRLTAALGASPVVVSTGGWGAFLHEHLDGIAHHDPHLVLRGVHTLLGLNVGDAGQRKDKA